MMWWRRRAPRRIWHRGRGRRRLGWFARLRIAIAAAALLGVIGYAVWLFANPTASPYNYNIWLPLLGV